MYRIPQGPVLAPLYTFQFHKLKLQKVKIINYFPTLVVNVSLQANTSGDDHRLRM